MTALLTRRSPDVAGVRAPARAAGRRRTGWLFLAPAMVLAGAWTYLPVLATGVISFLDWRLVGAPSPAGTANFERLFTDPNFGRAAWQTLAYAVGLLPFATVVPLLLAVMLWRRPGRASTVYRTLLFLPVMMAPTAVAVGWFFILNPLQGLANQLLGGLGLPQPNWLGDPQLALAVIVAITAARVIAFNMLLYSAALEGIDRVTLSAARLEGATSWEVTRFVVLPQVARTTVLLGLLSVVLAGQWAFTNISVLTAGGPDGATDNVYTLIYEYGFDFFETGLASAASVVVLLAFAVAGLAWAIVGRRRGLR